MTKGMNRSRETVNVGKVPRALYKRMTQGVNRSREMVNVGKVLRVVNERSKE
jgi:hypothetical protein